MPRSPAMVSIGSPGTMRIRKKASSVRPTNVGTTRPNRASAKRSMLRLEVDAVESMAAEWAELEVRHFLAHRHELDGMRDGEPRRLFLEDDLGLPVKRGALALIGQFLGFE